MAAKPGLMIALGLHPKPKSPGAPPSFGGKPAASPAAPPDPGEPDADDQGGAKGETKPNPEAVDYRTEAETCGHCGYMQDGGMCAHPIVAQQVQAGDSCAAFEPKGGDGGAGVAIGVGAPSAGGAGSYGQ